MRVPGLRRAVTIRFTRGHVAREIDDELRFHIEQRAARLVAEGMSPGAAEREARRRFGDPAEIRQRCLEQDVPQWRRATMRDSIDQFLGDLRFAARVLKGSPWFTATALSTLIVGIASVTAIFSFVYSFYWRPLPFPDIDQLVSIAEQRATGACCNGVSVATAEQIVARSRSFDRLARWDNALVNIVAGDAARQVHTLLVDTAFTGVLGIHARIGRLPSHEEILANVRVAAISSSLWQAAFGGDTAALGRRIRIGTEELTIIGVLPEHFGFPWRTDVLRPLAPIVVPAAENDRQTIGLIGRLRAGVARTTAEAELATIATSISHDVSAGIGPTRLRFQPEILDRRAQQGVPMPSLLIGAAVFLLLIACANVTNLMLVRSAERRAEMAVRAALGASRGRLIRQALTETTLLAAVAGAFGVIGSAGLVKVLSVVMPGDGRPSWLVFGLDGRVLVFALGIVIAATLVVGLRPAREGSRFDLTRALKVGGDGGSVRSGAARAARRGLAIQLALSIALFVAAGLFVKSYRNLSTIDFGYPADRIAQATLFFDANRYPTSAPRMEMAIALAERLRTKADIRSTAIRGYANTTLIGPASAVPFDERTGGTTADRLIPDGDTTRAVNPYRLMPPARNLAVSDEYFHTLHLRLRSGRTFDRRDAPGGEPAVVVSERLAATLWGTRNPLGRTLRRGATGPSFTVIGVVQDVRDLQGIRGALIADPHADAYYSVRQVEAPTPEVIVETASAPTNVGPIVTAELRALDRTLVSRVGQLSGADDARLVAAIFGGIVATFAIAGTVLSVIGLYGVVAYGVAQRRREIGVRIALGATRDAVVGLIVRQSLRFVGAGLVAGLLVAVAGSRVFSVFLFHVSPIDPVIYAIAVVLFGAVATVGCWWPARRAATIDPVSALRSD